MKRPVLKRTVRTVEIVTWTLEYEDAPDEAASGKATAVALPTHHSPFTIPHSQFTLHNYSGDPQ